MATDIGTPVWDLAIPRRLNSQRAQECTADEATSLAGELKMLVDRALDEDVGEEPIDSDDRVASERDQRDGSQRARPGHARRAKRGGAPQGTRNFEERSDLKVYGATPSSVAKETVTLPKEHRGDGRMSGRRSPSGEPPEVPGDAASKTGHSLEHDERNEE